MKAFQEYWPTHGWQLTKQLLERNKPPRWCSTRCQRCWKWFPCYSTFVELPYPDSRVFLGALPLAHSCWQHPGIKGSQLYDVNGYQRHRNGTQRSFWYTDGILAVSISSIFRQVPNCHVTSVSFRVWWFNWMFGMDDFLKSQFFFYSSSASKKTGDLPTKNTHWAESFRCSLGFPRV